MIALIISLSIIEIITGLWIINKLCSYTKLVSNFNANIKKSGFTGNITPLRISLMNFNEHSFAKKDVEKKIFEFQDIIQAINAVLVIVPFIQMLFFRKKHK